MNFHQAATYLRLLLSARSTAGHGVHSPYMFDFLTKVVRGRNDDGLLRQVGFLRQEMVCDQRTVTVTDMGAGSFVSKKPVRQMSEIARTATLPAREAALLTRILQNPLPGTRSNEQGIILELGTSLGITTLALALAAPERKVISVEGCPALAEIARENLARNGVANATVINMEFSTALDELRAHNEKVSFAFIDGNHRGAAMKDYVMRITDMSDEMIIAADDIHLTRDMYLAWKSLVNSAIAPATMEMMRLGLIFYLKDITPGRYRIRY